MGKTQTVKIMLGRIIIKISMHLLSAKRKLKVLGNKVIASVSNVDRIKLMKIPELTVLFSKSFKLSIALFFVISLDIVIGIPEAVIVISKPTIESVI